MRNYHIFKRIIDILISLIGILVLSPLFLVLAIWIKLTSKGPVVYKHTRIGKDGKPFEIYKFRSMFVGARNLQKERIRREEVITSSGRFIRKTFLDELLQLFNVLKGDMSLVGPRPFDRENFRKKYKNIFKIKPGITSLESVADYLSEQERVDFEKHFKDLLEKDVYKDFDKHRFLLDLYYVKNESFLLDINIIIHTIFLVIKRIFSKKERNWRF